MSQAATPYLVVGNPENRRIGLFLAALRSRGHPKPRVVSHLDALTGKLATIGDTPLWVRLEATGENATLERRFLELGYDDAVQAGVTAIDPETLRDLKPMRGQILCPRQRHLGFLRYLRQLQRTFDQRPGWRLLQPTADVEELFDKRLTSRRYAAAGIPVPELLGDVATPDALRDAVRDAGWQSVFVKLSCGSSASCLAYYRPPQKTRYGMLQTTIRRTPKGWFNSLKLQRVDSAAGIDEILSFLLREGSQVERAIPKARLERAFMDCRVLMIAAEPAFVVVRQSSHPITNLHLGGRRGDFEALRRAVPPASWDAALESCRQVFQQHSCFHLGIDLLFEPGFREHRILEANAFGDLLPNLRRRGLDVYEWQIEKAGG